MVEVHVSTAKCVCWTDQKLYLFQVTDTLAQSRAWATVSVPSAGVPNIVTIATLTKQVSHKFLLAFPLELLNWNIHSLIT